MRAIILKFYYMPNSLNSIIHNKILPNFQECWENRIKWSVTNFVTQRLSKYEKKLLLRSGETDYCYPQSGPRRRVYGLGIISFIIIICHFLNPDYFFVMTFKAYYMPRGVIHIGGPTLSWADTAIICAETLSSLKSQLKKHLFCQAFNVRP